MIIIRDLKFKTLKRNIEKYTRGHTSSVVFKTNRDIIINPPIFIITNISLQ